MIEKRLRITCCSIVIGFSFYRCNYLFPPLVEEKKEIEQRLLQSLEPTLSLCFINKTTLNIPMKSLMPQQYVIPLTHNIFSPLAINFDELE